MPELIAEYGDDDTYELPVVSTTSAGDQMVLWEGKLWPASDVVLHGRRLTGFSRAPYSERAEPGYAADFKKKHEDGTEERWSSPVVFWLVYEDSHYYRPVILTADGPEPLSEFPHERDNYLGISFNGTPFYDEAEVEERKAFVAALKAEREAA